MTSIIYIGMDVHITNYTLCCYTVDADDTFAVVNVKPDYHEILKYMDRVPMNIVKTVFQMKL